MSDSDDDIPLGQRVVAPKETVAAAPAAKPKVVKDDSSDSDDDKPIAARQVPPKKIERPKTAEKPKAKSTASGSKPATKKSAGEKKPAPKKAPAPAKKSTGSATSGKSTERVKRVFDMPGQTRDAPGEEDSLRRFYTSLLEQDPSSEMARRWCAMTGLLPRDEAEKWVAEQTRRKISGKSSPVKAAPKRKGTASTAAPKRKATAPPAKKEKKKSKKKADDSDDDSSSSSEDEKDFKSAKKSKPSTSKPKASAAPAAAKKPSKKIKEDSSDSDNSSSDDDAEVLPQPKQRSTDKKTTRDVAFTDGGLDGTDSDDDVPLGQRIKAAA